MTFVAYGDLEKDNESFCLYHQRIKKQLLSWYMDKMEECQNQTIFLESFFTLRIKNKNVSKCVNLVVKEDDEDQWGFTNIHRYNRELGFMPYCNDKKAFDSIRGDNVPYFHTIWFEPIQYWMCNIEDIDAEKAYLQFKS